MVGPPRAGGGSAGGPGAANDCAQPSSFPEAEAPPVAAVANDAGPSAVAPTDSLPAGTGAGAAKPEEHLASSTSFSPLPLRPPDNSDGGEDGGGGIYL